jgi:hypothetical protein
MFFKHKDDEYRNYLFNQQLANLDFSAVVTNDDLTHCFIEFMGKQNVQNLISFYLNADIYRQFAKKELSKVFSDMSDDLSAKSIRINDSQDTLKDFAKGLIHSYLLNANNFVATTHDFDEKPVNILNHIYYKADLAQAIDNLDNRSCLNETLLDELQAKIYLLMKQKYYQDFKSYSEFHKILHKNDLLDKLIAAASASTNTHQSSSSTSAAKSIRLITNPIILGQYLDCENNEDDLLTNSLSNTFDLDSSFDSDSNIASADVTSDSISQSSFEHLGLDSSNGVFSIHAVINSCGRCNDLKSTYAIYIIDVTKEYEIFNNNASSLNQNKSEYWQTYRRFNDFHDMHLILKKKFPNIMQNFSLPTKSLRTNLNDEFLEKRRAELNKYLQVI